jgi:hypothetical protein
MLQLFVVVAAAAASPAGMSAHPATSAAIHAGKPDEATVGEAIRLLDGDGFDENAMRSIDLVMGVTMAGMVDQLHKRYGDQLPGDLVEQLRTTVHDYAVDTMRAHLQEMKRKTAEIYAQEFTKAELVRLRELHADPVAVKARERFKDMQPRLMQIGVQTMRAAQPDLDAKIKRVVTDYLTAHGKAAAPAS